MPQCPPKQQWGGMKYKVVIKHAQSDYNHMVICFVIEVKRPEGHPTPLGTQYSITPTLGNI